MLSHRFIQEYYCLVVRNWLLGGDTLATLLSTLNGLLKSVCHHLEFCVVYRHVTLLLSFVEHTRNTPYELEV